VNGEICIISLYHLFGDNDRIVCLKNDSVTTDTCKAPVSVLSVPKLSANFLM
jgi:hypothetical protein